MEEVTTASARIQRWDFGSAVRRIACGHAFTVVALANGNLVSWGSNVLGQCGVTDHAVPYVRCSLTLFQHNCSRS
jgi:alpha-tubulin suppressor-like RCC1 family protein